MLTLRPYQQGALDAVTRYLAREDGNPCVELPTGAGKTPLMAALAKHYCTTWTDTRVLCLAHVRELVSQSAAKLREIWPEGDIGVYSASLNSRDLGCQVTFANIQSVYDKALSLGLIHLVFVDEAHRIPAKDQGMYRQLIAALKANYPHLRVIGFTATPYRMDSGMVTGKDTVLSDICYSAGVADLIEQGFLCRPVVKDGNVKPDVAGLRIVASDYAKAALETECLKVVEAACADLVARAAARRAWIIFTAGGDHALAVQRILREQHGLDLPVVLDRTPARERDRIVREYKAREHRGLINVNIFSEGFDAPHVDCVAMMRPTKSAGMYYQQVGRGFRTHPDKRDFLVLDYAGNVLEHGPIDMISARAKGKSNSEKGEALTKKCPGCDELVALTVRQCPDCGHEFPPPVEKPKHAATPSEAAILAAEAAIWHDVRGVDLGKHEKPGKPPSLRVTYTIGLMRANEWHCFEHGGPVRARACAWWMHAGGRLPYPRDIDEALRRRDEITPPKRVKLHMAGKYPEIVAHDFA